MTPQRPDLAGLAATAGLGGPASLEAVEHAYHSASRMLAVALQFGATGAYGLDDLSLKVAVASEPELGSLLMRQYLDPLAGEGEFGELLEETLREFLGNGQRILETSKRLGIHANTLRYRLDRFEKLTGTSLVPAPGRRRGVVGARVPHHGAPVPPPGVALAVEIVRSTNGAGTPAGQMSVDGSSVPIHDGSSLAGKRKTRRRQRGGIRGKFDLCRRPPRAHGRTLFDDGSETHQPNAGSPGATRRPDARRLRRRRHDQFAAGNPKAGAGNGVAPAGADTARRPPTATPAPDRSPRRTPTPPPRRPVRLGPAGEPSPASPVPRPTAPKSASARPRPGRAAPASGHVIGEGGARPAARRPRRRSRDARRTRRTRRRQRRSDRRRCDRQGDQGRRHLHARHAAGLVHAQADGAPHRSRSCGS